VEAIMKVSALLLVLFFGAQAWTQTGSKKSDSVRPGLKLASLSSPATRNPLLAESASPERSLMPDPIAPAPFVTTPVPREQNAAVDRTVDKKFLILFGMTAALTVTDIELTQRCMRAGTCHEANFLCGTNPTRARMYGINIPILGGQAIFSAWLKRRHPERNGWMISPIADSVAHGVGSVSGAIR
jgi:hypothetical protein